jgi:hypothetical protein
MVVPGSGEAGSLRDRIFAQRAADNASQFRVATGEWPVKFRDPFNAFTSSADRGRIRLGYTEPPQGRLAQLGEHQLDKLGVTGSSPVPPTYKSPALGGVFLRSHSETDTCGRAFHHDCQHDLRGAERRLPSGQTDVLETQRLADLYGCGEQH